MKNTSIHTREAHGFTLVEVTIALGIAAFGIVSVLGLLPQGLDQVRKASDLGAEARIYQQITQNIAQVEWEEGSGEAAAAAETNTRRYHFDHMAQQIVGQGSSPRVAYVADLRVEPAGVVLPGGEADSNLRRIFIRLLKTAIADADLDETDGPAVRTYSTLITRAGR